MNPAATQRLACLCERKLLKLKYHNSLPGAIAASAQAGGRWQRVER